MRVHALTVAAALFATALPAAAQTRLPAPLAPSVTVSGQGSVTRAPDRATLGLQVVTNDAAAATATSQNNAVYAGLRSRMAALGIPETAIKTLSFEMEFVPKPADNATYKPPRTGYVVTRSLAIDIDNLANAGKAIDGAVGAGVTQVGGVSYGLRDQRAAYNGALAAAVKDAEGQAAAIAEAAHMHLGPVRTLNTGGSSGGGAVPMMRTMAAAAPQQVPTEIQPSAVEVRATVNATYTLTP